MVVLIQPTIQPVGVELLQQECRVTLAPDGAEDTLIRSINESRADAIVTRVEKITKRILESCPSLAVVGQHGVGVDNIDVNAATQCGVLVLNVPGANYMSVAEHTILFILALSRKLLVSDAKTRQGQWEYRNQFYPMEINGKTLLIIGLGRIGQEVARKAKAFNLRLLGYDPFVSSEDMALLGVQKAGDLAAGVPEADFLSVHVPLTAQTRHLVNRDLLASMKPTACLINVGRGPVVDQNALYAALKQGSIAGAALDVLAQEPPDCNDPLLKLENVIFTPHFAGDTKEAKHRCSLTLATEIVKVLNGSSSANVVNPKVLAAGRFNSLTKISKGMSR
jgi:D-3-phosphoglycerate dehydrogenase